VIVADTNLVAYLLLEGENTATAERVLEKDSHWIAPLLWRSELRNVLATYVRQDLLSLEEALEIQEAGEVLLGAREYSLVSEDVLRVAQRSGCAAYDCELAVLAQQHEIPLVTSDRRVLDAFPGVAVHPRSFVGLS